MDFIILIWDYIAFFMREFKTIMEEINKILQGKPLELKISIISIVSPYTYKTFKFSLHVYVVVYHLQLETFII